MRKWKFPFMWSWSLEPRALAFLNQVPMRWISLFVLALVCKGEKEGGAGWWCCIGKGVVFFFKRVWPFFLRGASLPRVLVACAIFLFGRGKAEKDFVKRRGRVEEGERVYFFLVKYSSSSVGGGRPFENVIVHSNKLTPAYYSWTVRSESSV